MFLAEANVKYSCKNVVTLAKCHGTLSFSLNFVAHFLYDITILQAHFWQKACNRDTRAITTVLIVLPIYCMNNETYEKLTIFCWKF